MANRLANETSPYLLQHRYNPVDWHPWGPEALDRARSEEWSYEQFAAVLLKTEIDSRDSHGGQARIKAARFPARKTLDEFDFTLQTWCTRR